MRITSVVGGQLEKDRSNSPEDSFSRSTVTYVIKGDEKTFSVLYPLFFEDRAVGEGLVNADESIQEMIGLCFFELFPERKRLYVSDEAEFLEALKKMDNVRIQEKLNEINTKSQ
ncbi:hypothetical protein [Alkalihalobacillus sp. R86527]|uniref:hypothetical protein n=1 Tax=Alkalihalobacillus sp. R86527 TaxID=3093863 RepID=UPI00366E0554